MHGQLGPLAEVVGEVDFIITVCDNAHEGLTDHAADLRWSVPDPVREGSERAFDAAFEELARRVTDLAPRLTAA